MRLAIVALNAYPAIVPSAGTAIGGLETFAWSLARTLASDSGTSVHFLVRHTSHPAQDMVDGVRLHFEVEPNRSVRQAVSRDIEFLGRFPWLRVHHFRPALLWQIPLLAFAKLTSTRSHLTSRVDLFLKDSQPDVVLALGAGEGTAAAVQAAKFVGVPAWVWWQSNSDLNSRFVTDDTFVESNGVRAADARAAYRADGFICQTQWQQNQTTQLLHQNSTLIPNPVNSERFPVGEATATARPEVLWIGRFDRHHKRPHLALEIARLCPQIPFQFVINQGDPIVEQEVRGNCPPNVRLIEYIPRDAMPDAYRSARLFLSTGSQAYEGFPNVLLEAAASGTPIVSLEDFDSFLKRSGAGFSSGEDLAQLAGKIRELWALTPEWHTYSRSGAEYVRRHHSLSTCVTKFREAVLRTP